MKWSIYVFPVDGRTDDMRKWLSGRALASQAEDRGFESRLPLHRGTDSIESVLFFIGSLSNSVGI